MLKDMLITWRAYFFDAVTRIEDESLAERNSAHDTRRLDLHVFGIIILAGIVLSLQEYYGSSNGYKYLEWPLSWITDDSKNIIKNTFNKSPKARLHRLFYWVCATFSCYLILPSIYIKVFMRKRIRDFGFSIKGILKHSWIYVSMYLLILPALFVVGQTNSFQRTYPFYKGAGDSLFDFFAWEIAYTLQFLSLEFFFRGFLIHGLKHRFGYYCIMIPVIPYCMIHFGKPLPETLGAIFAGLALGTLSLFTRSIWLGVAVHVSVAVSMDIIALWHLGKIF